MKDVKIQVENFSITAGIETQILSENEFISEDIRNCLKEKFQNRFGWILQQIIKLKFASESKSPAVLIMDADTVLLQPISGIDQNRVQQLSFSSEMQNSYFKFLRYLGLGIERPLFSTVTHHMIVQPIILRELLIDNGLDDLNKLIKKLVEFRSFDPRSPVSLDYEFCHQAVGDLCSEIFNHFY
jgi:hypothetical protein